MTWYTSHGLMKRATTIMYTLIDPSLDDQNGDQSTDSAITIINDFKVSSYPQNRDWPAIDVDQ